MYYYNNELPPQRGWICPKCGRVNAPWKPSCDCVSTQTSGVSYLVETSSISRDSHEIAKDEPQADGILFKGNPKEGDYKLIKTTNGWVLEGNDIAYYGEPQSGKE